MKIRYLKHKDIDKQRWDHCMEQAQNGLIYALSWYLDITSPGWDALVYGDYEAVMPLTWRKKYGLKYLIQPYYSQQLGVFGNLSKSHIALRFLQAIPLKFLFVIIKLNKDCQCGKLRGVKWNRNYELDLSSEYENILKNYTKRHIRNVQLGYKKKLSIQQLSDENTFISFYRKFIAKKITELPERHFIIFEKLFHEVKNREISEIYGVYDDQQKLCSISLFVRSFDRWILLATATNEDGRKKRAMFFLIDTFIRKHAGNSRILDFEGSNIESIAFFYEGFGAKPTQYPGLNFITIFPHIG